MAPKYCDVRLESLIVRLRDEEGMSFGKIAQHFKMSKDSVHKVYKRINVPAKHGRVFVTLGAMIHFSTAVLQP